MVLPCQRLPENIKDWPVIGEKVYDLWQSASINLEQTLEKYNDQLRDIGKKLIEGALSTDRSHYSNFGIVYHCCHHFSLWRSW